MFLKRRFMPFFNIDGGSSGGEGGTSGVDSASEAGVQPGSEGVKTGAEVGSEAGNPPVGDETAWAKRIAAVKEKAIAEARSEWEKESSERYKDYDVYKDIAEYTRETSGYQDVLSVKEAIELERLQARAEKENVPAEVLKRIDELEKQAAEGMELKKQQEETKVYQDFRTNLEAFAKEQNVDPDQLHQFMHDNQIGKFDVALKAMKFDEVQSQVENAKKEGVKEFLAAKGSIPKVEGGGSTNGQVIPGTAKTFNDARARAAARLEASGKLEG